MHLWLLYAHDAESSENDENSLSSAECPWELSYKSTWVESVSSKIFDTIVGPAAWEGSAKHRLVNSVSAKRQWAIFRMAMVEF